MGISLEKRYIRVREVLFHNEQNNYTIFQATTSVRSGGVLKDTKDRACYTGYFLYLCPDDQLEVQFQRLRTKFYGEQLYIANYTKIAPGTADEMKRFLTNHIEGMGPVLAGKLISAYGLDVINTIVSDPAALDPFVKNSAKKQAIRDTIITHQSFSNLLTRLSLFKVDHRYATAIYNRYGTDSVQHLVDDPYELYLEGLVDFGAAESIAFQQNIPYDTPRRISSVLHMCLMEDSQNNGNLFLPQADILPRCNRMVKAKKSPYKDQPLSTDQIEFALKNGVASNRYFVDQKNPQHPVYLLRNYKDEEGIIQGLIKIMQGAKKYRYIDMDIMTQVKTYQLTHRIRIADAQSKAIFTALKNPISIITGGPGTGKTLTVNTLVSVIKALSPNASIKMTAPTGKAAVRIQELTGKKATTVHMMLGLVSGDYSLDLDVSCDFLIVDEFSMVDASLCNKLLEKIEDHTRLILVGDFNQLPSVGPGLVLRDMISSHKIPTVTLNEIFRQAGASKIILNSHEIVSKKEPVLDIPNIPNSDFYFLDCDTIDETVHKVRLSIDQMLSKRGYRFDDIQVLSPIHRSDIGVDHLNYIFQQQYNPYGEAFTFEDQEFRVGDRVMNTHNDYTLGVVNGEVGIVRKIGVDADSILGVEFPNHNDLIYYSMGHIQNQQLELAYAMTVHKSQGSEFPVVILPVSKAVAQGLNRNLIYTAWTRAKEVVIMVGDRQVLYQSLKKSVIDERNSLLTQKLRLNL